MSPPDVPNSYRLFRNARCLRRSREMTLYVFIPITSSRGAITVRIVSKTNEDGSVEFTVQLTGEEANGLGADAEAMGIFTSKSEYCVTCTSPQGPVSPPQTIEAYGDIHANVM